MSLPHLKHFFTFLAFIAFTTSFNKEVGAADTLHLRLDSALVSSGLVRNKMGDRDVRYSHNDIEFVKVTGPSKTKLFEGQPTIGIFLLRSKNKAHIDKTADLEKTIGATLRFGISDKAKILHRLVKSNISEEWEPFLTSDGRCYVSVSIDKVIYACKSS